MSATPTTALQRVQALLREGKVQEADDLASKAITDEAAAADAPAGKPTPPPPPRKPEQVLVDLFDTISAHLGHPPSLSGLLDEIKTLWQEL